MYDELFKKLDFYNKNKQILNKEILEKINKAFDINFTYDSTTIEGNTLTLIETKAVLEDNISIGGKKLREIYEVTNNNEAFNYVKNAIRNNESLDEEKVKDIHEIVTKNITPPTPNDMYNQLRFFYNDLEENNSKMNPIELSAWTHAEFVRIHPFPDGNGRTARLIMNYQLMKRGLLPINIKVQDRLEYYDTLDKYAVQKDITPFMDFIASIEEKRIDEINLVINQQISSNNIKN